jgi:hypothetical protein
MTRDEILNMEAGRDMDALVAEKAMGWTRCRIPTQSKDDPLPRGWNIGKGSGWEAKNCTPQFSTDIAAAWRVVLHEMNKGSCPNLVNDDNGHWALSFVGVNNIPCTTQTSFVDDPRLWCDTASLAICRAALLATMEGE